MEGGRQASTPKGKGKGKGTKQAGVLKGDNRTETPEIKKDEGVENPDKDTLEPSDVNKGPDADGKEVAPPAGEDGKDDSPEGGSVDANTEGESPAVNIEEAGTGRFVDEALDQSRENQKQAFQNLINEGVKTENDLKKVSAELAETKELLEHKAKELEFEREATQELRTKVHDLEVKLATCQPPPEPEAEKPSLDAGAGETEEEAEQEDGFITTEQKLKDLQLRLKRMANDEEAKDAYVTELTIHLKALEGVLDDLEPHVDKAKWQEAMDKKKAAVEQQQEGHSDELPRADNVVRTSDGLGRSRMCAVM